MTILCIIITESEGSHSFTRIAAVHAAAHHHTGSAVPSQTCRVCKIDGMSVGE
jgi:hypothetical protein